MDAGSTGIKDSSVAPVQTIAPVSRDLAMAFKFEASRQSPKKMKTVSFSSNQIIRRWTRRSFASVAPSELPSAINEGRSRRCDASITVLLWNDHAYCQDEATLTLHNTCMHTNLTM